MWRMQDPPRSRTIQILLVSTALGAFGLHTPLIYLAAQVNRRRPACSCSSGRIRRAPRSRVAATSSLPRPRLGRRLLHFWLAAAAGEVLLVVVGGDGVLSQRSGECRVGRQYLCQVSHHLLERWVHSPQACLLVCGLGLLALPAVEVALPPLPHLAQGYRGYVTFTWVYGLFLGGYHYSLKMYVYQKVRARNFARAWGYIQVAALLPCFPPCRPARPCPPSSALPSPPTSPPPPAPSLATP